ncbi:hypothetical protein ATY30_10885 [Sinorhizobium americanum]|nr:hypothetical protein ATY30_10885 [Sinorhizobium americanum]
MNLRKRNPSALGDLDDGDASQHRARIAPLVAAAAVAADQPLRLIEMQRRDGDAAPFGDLADGKLPPEIAALFFLHRCY